MTKAKNGHGKVPVPENQFFDASCADVACNGAGQSWQRQDQSHGAGFAHGDERAIIRFDQSCNAAAEIGGFPVGEGLRPDRG